jgi:hypothetical protein
MKTLMVLTTLLALFGCGPKFPEGTPVSYQYSYSGTMMYYITWYEVAQTPDGGVTISYSTDCSDEITVLKAPSDALEKIGAMAKEHNLNKLKNSYLPDMEILDGYGWHMFIEFPDGYIGSGGSNAWPPAKLWSGIAAINAYIQGIIDASTPSDIIGKKSHRDA